MLKKMRKSHSPAVAFLAITLLAGCDRSPAVSVEDAVITLPALAGQPGAAYFRLETNAPPERLVRIETDAGTRVEMHETVMEGATAGMKALSTAQFDADGTLAFAPGRRHAMLFGVKSGLAPGGTAKITFVFEKAPPVTAEAEIRGPGQGHAGH
jgi:copper(I)-binding protein